MLHGTRRHNLDSVPVTCDSETVWWGRQQRTVAHRARSQITGMEGGFAGRVPNPGRAGRSVGHSIDIDLMGEMHDRTRGRYSHSIVLGGLLLMSYTTRFTPRTVFVIRVEIDCRTG